MQDILGPLARLLLPANPDPLEVLRMRLMAVQLAKELDGVVAVGQVDLRALCQAGERGDLIVVGARGSGKTATALACGQVMAKAQGRPLRLVGWPPAIAEEVGGEATKVGLHTLSECVVVLDEAALRIPTGKRTSELYEAIALARHRDVSLIWTSQGLGGVHRDVLRMEAGLICKRLDPFAVRFEREEATDIAARAVALQSRFPELAGVERGLVMANGAWYACETWLPDGWSDRVSRLWR